MCIVGSVLIILVFSIFLCRCIVTVCDVLLIDVVLKFLSRLVSWMVAGDFNLTYINPCSIHYFFSLSLFLTGVFPEKREKNVSNILKTMVKHYKTIENADQPYLYFKI